MLLATLNCSDKIFKEKLSLAAASVFICGGRSSLQESVTVHCHLSLCHVHCLTARLRWTFKPSNPKSAKSANPKIKGYAGLFPPRPVFLYCVTVVVICDSSSSKYFLIPTILLELLYYFCYGKNLFIPVRCNRNRRTRTRNRNRRRPNNRRRRNLWGYG